MYKQGCWVFMPHTDRSLVHIMLLPSIFDNRLSSSWGVPIQLQSLKFFYSVYKAFRLAAVHNECAHFHTL